LSVHSTENVPAFNPSPSHVAAGPSGATSTATTNGTALADPSSTTHNTNGNGHSPHTEPTTKAAPPRRTKHEILSSPVRPMIAAPCLESIPAELKAYRQLVCWKYYKKKGETTWRKLPLTPLTRTFGSSTNPSAWGTYYEASESCKTPPVGMYGLGFSLTDDDPYTLIDLDNCRDPDTGEMDDWAVKLVRKLESYTEISPTGTGVKVWARAWIPEAVKTDSIEMYYSKRFATITGQHYPGSPTEIFEQQEAVAELFHKHKGYKTSEAKHKHYANVSYSIWSNGLDDDVVLDKARSAQNRAELEKLLSGDLSDYYHKNPKTKLPDKSIGTDHSRADLALSSRLAFFTGPDPVQLERLFDRTPLGQRDKWVEREDYRSWTLDKALKNRAQENRFWVPGKKEVLLPQRTARACLSRFGHHADGSVIRKWRGAWFVWNGKNYEEHSKDWINGKVNGMLQEEVQRTYHRAMESYTKRLNTQLGQGNTNRQTQEAIVLQAVKSEHVTNTLGAMAGIEGVVLADDVELNSVLEKDGRGAKQDLVAMANGILNIEAYLAGKDLVLGPHTPLWFSPVVLPYPFEADGKCELWLRLLDQIFEGDQERIDLLQEWFGYNLTPTTNLEMCMIMVGEGRNGKGVVTAVLRALLREKNCSSVPLEEFDPRHSFSLIMTLGKLANIVTEVGELQGVAEGRVKAFISGEKMPFDRKYLPAIQAAPTARLTVATNIVPKFADKSDGIWRRLRIVPFNYQVKPEEKKVEYRERTWWEESSGEMPGIMKWALQGLQRLRENKEFTYPQVCQSALRQHRRISNPAMEYLMTTFEFVDGHDVFTPSDIVYMSYTKWHKDQGFKEVPLSKPAFGKEVVKVLPYLQGSKKWSTDKVAVRRGPRGRQELVYQNLVFSDPVLQAKIKEKFGE
jgi:P4 family phage/plasmid primase-like protien